MAGENLNEKIRQHIQQLVKTAGLPDNEESLEALVNGWEEKQSSFETQVEERDMEQVEEFTADDERGALLMTYSGSLIHLGPKGENGRFVAYYSVV